MPFERFIEIHETKYFKNDIEKMNRDQIKTLCSFLDKEGDLRFVQSHCDEGFAYIIDNILFL